MFGKKKETGEPKKLSPKEVIMNRLEQLGPGQALRFKLPETYGGGLAVIELNPQYPGKGKKYTMSTEKLAGDKPSGSKTTLWDTDKPKDLASWVLDRNAQPFS